jgi:hypothetical protein
MPAGFALTTSRMCVHNGHMTTTENVLTMADLTALETISRAAITCARIAWVDRVTGRINYGTARSIGDENGNFLRRDKDVRDGFLRITTRGGWEHFVRVRDLMPLVHSGHFAEYDWRLRTCATE